MKTSKYHISNLGGLGPVWMADEQGYVTIHINSRYASASDYQLDVWTRSGSKLVRAAAETEIAERKLAAK